MTPLDAIKKIHEFLEELPKPFLSFFAFLLVLVIGGLDTITSYNISITILYIFPIILVAWYEGGLSAALLSLVSAVILALSDLTSDHMYSPVSITIWNGMMALGIFLIVAFSISVIKKLMIKTREYDNTDDLTGISNVRFFYGQARIAIGKSAVHKQPFTLAYIDINNLRQINDTLGHIVGDYLLHEAARTIKSTLRSTDIISRLGGAKFAVLMPDSKNEDIEVAIRTVQEQLSAMLKQNNWPVTFSIGVVTCNSPACTIDRLIKMAEDLVRTVREDGKNMVKYQTADLPPAVN